MNLLLWRNKCDSGLGLRRADRSWSIDRRDSKNWSRAILSVISWHERKLEIRMRQITNLDKLYYYLTCYGAMRSSRAFFYWSTSVFWARGVLQELHGVMYINSGVCPTCQNKCSNLWDKNLIDMILIKPPIKRHRFKYEVQLSRTRYSSEERERERNPHLDTAQCSGKDWVMDWSYFVKALTSRPHSEGDFDCGRHYSSNLDDLYSLGTVETKPDQRIVPDTSYILVSQNEKNYQLLLIRLREGLSEYSDS